MEIGFKITAMTRYILDFEEEPLKDEDGELLAYYDDNE